MHARIKLCRCKEGLNMFSSAKSAIVILFVIILSFVAVQNSVAAPFGGGGGGGGGQHCSNAGSWYNCQTTSRKFLEKFRVVSIFAEHLTFLHNLTILFLIFLLSKY